MLRDLINIYNPNGDDNVLKISYSTKNILRALNDDEWAFMKLPDLSGNDMTIPINKVVIKQLQIIKESITFVMDKPCSTLKLPIVVTESLKPIEQSEDKLESIEERSLREIELLGGTDRANINALILFIFYGSMIYLPYADFAIDDFPIIEEVLIDGKPSTLFSECVSYIKETFVDKYDPYFVYKKNKTFINCKKINKLKGVKVIYTRILDDYPLFLALSKFSYKTLASFNNLEVTLHYYRKDSLYIESMGAYDEFMYAVPGFHGVLHLALCLPFLLAYVMGTLKSKDAEYDIGMTIKAYYYKVTSDSRELKHTATIHMDKMVQWKISIIELLKCARTR